MHATVIAIADEAAAAADLVRGKTSGEPAVRVRGLGRHVIADDGPGAAAIVRPWAPICSARRPRRRTSTAAGWGGEGADRCWLASAERAVHRGIRD